MFARRYSWVAVTVIFAWMTIPAFSSAQAQRQTHGPHGAVVRAAEELRPYALGRHVGLSVHAAASPSMDELSDEALHDRVVNLLANAIAMAVGGYDLDVTVSATRICVWVPNPTLNFSVDRTVRDIQGHTFMLRSVAGRGSELSLSLP